MCVLYTYIYTYICIERERERDRERYIHKDYLVEHADLDPALGTWGAWRKARLETIYLNNDNNNNMSMNMNMNMNIDKCIPYIQTRFRKNTRSKQN